VAATAGTARGAGTTTTRKITLAQLSAAGALSGALPHSSPSMSPNPAFQFGTTELLCASPTRCSTLGLYAAEQDDMPLYLGNMQ